MKIPQIEATNGEGLSRKEQRVDDDKIGKGIRENRMTQNLHLGHHGEHCVNLNLHI